MSQVAESLLNLLYNGLGNRNKNRKVFEVIDGAYQRYCQKKENTLENIGIPYKNEVEKKLLSFICDLSNQYVLHNKKDKDTYKEIKKIFCEQYEKLEDTNLLLLEMFLLCSGLYEMAYEVREVADLKKIEYYEKKKTIAFRDVFSVFWGYIQLGKNEEAFNALNKADRLFVMFFKKEIEFFKSILKRNVGQGANLSLCQEDKIFGDYINGKRILIIGPAENGNDIQKYISEHDVVISMLYRRNMDMDVKDKIHISYYSGLACIKMEEENRDYFSELDMAVFKKIRHNYQKELLQDGKAREPWGYKTECKGKKTEMRFDMIYSNKCSSNLLQIILLDLLLFSPQKMTVINTNLFLAQKRYNDKYKVAGTEQNTYSFRRSFAFHNMINMYQLTKFLYDSKIIFVDDVCKNVLEPGMAEYARRMQELEG